MSVPTAVLDPALLALGGAVWRWTRIELRSRQLTKELSQARQQATDCVTGFPTRATWESVASARISADPAHSMVLIGDLDDFKHVNDELGHPAGDAVLHTIGARLADHFARTEGAICRLGGDEFGIIARDSDLADDLDALAGSVTTPIVLPTKHQVTVGISLGCARGCQLGESPTLGSFLEQADAQLIDRKHKRARASSHLRALPQQRT